MGTGLDNKDIDKNFLKKNDFVHRFFSWVSKGGDSEQLLFFALFYQSTPSCLKVMGGVVGWDGGGGGPCDFSVSPSPFGLDFGTLDFGTSDLGLTIQPKIKYHSIENIIDIGSKMKGSKLFFVRI